MSSTAKQSQHHRTIAGRQGLWPLPHCCPPSPSEWPCGCHVDCKVLTTPAPSLLVPDDKSSQRGSRPQEHTHTEPGVCTHRQSRSGSRPPGPGGKAARPGDPGQPPKGPLECTAHRAMTGTRLPVGLGCQPSAPGGQQTAGPLNWNAEQAGALATALHRLPGCPSALAEGDTAVTSPGRREREHGSQAGSRLSIRSPL